MLLTFMLVAQLGREAEAGTVVSLYGDIDCFGVPGLTSCPDGSTLAGPVTDNRDPTELAANSLTDIWIVPGLGQANPPNPLTYSHI
jgi:hypothetical protein